MGSHADRHDHSGIGTLSVSPVKLGAGHTVKLVLWRTRSTDQRAPVGTVMLPVGDTYTVLGLTAGDGVYGVVVVVVVVVVACHSVVRSRCSGGGQVQYLFLFYRLPSLSAVCLSPPTLSLSL